MLHLARTRFPTGLALVTSDKDGKSTKRTFTDYEELVITCAKAFLKLGLEKFHSVCILGSNSEEWIISDLGAIYAGGLAAGIYTTSSPEACLHCAKAGRANIIVVQNQLQLNKIVQIREQLPLLKAVIQYEGKPIHKGVLSWEELMDIGRRETHTRINDVLAHLCVNECSTLVFTSGTTGKPKAVMLSHDNMTWNGRIIADYLGSMDEVVVSYLPLNHVAAQVMDLYVSISVGATVHFGDENALRGTLINTLKEAKPTVFLGVPRVWEKMSEALILQSGKARGLKKRIVTWATKVALEYHMDRSVGAGTPRHPRQYNIAKALIFQQIRKKLGLQKCKQMFNGAAPLSTEVKEVCWGFDLRVMEGFGMSETAGCQTINTNKAYKMKSIGRTLPGCYTKINKPDSNNEGEVLMKGRNIFMGYLNDLPNTQESFDKDGWFHSGDLGKIDKDGFVYITGRMKEIIITAGGENIPPVPIEDAVKNQLPCVSNAVLVGDQRKFLSMLLTFKCKVNAANGEPYDELDEATKAWCRKVGSPATTVTQARNDEKVRAAVQAGLERANVFAQSRAQRVQKFVILPHDFSIVTGEMGPTMKVMRRVVISKYATAIESLYSDLPPAKL